MFYGFRLQVIGHVALAVEEFSTDSGVRQNPFVSITLQGAFGDTQRPADILAVDSAVRGLGVEFLLQLLCGRRQGFQSSEEQSSGRFLDTNNFSHNFTFLIDTHVFRS